MSRWIDADALKEKIDDIWANRSLSFLGARILTMIDNEPHIDIVRCKECKYNYNKVLNHGKMYPRCDFTDRKLSENDYCSRGEREGE